MFWERFQNEHHAYCREKTTDFDGDFLLWINSYIEIHAADQGIIFNSLSFELACFWRISQRIIFVAKYNIKGIDSIKIKNSQKHAASWVTDNLSIKAVWESFCLGMKALTSYHYISTGICGDGCWIHVYVFWLIFLFYHII